MADRRDPTLAIVSALRRDPGGMAIVWCSDLAVRDRLILDVASIAGPEAPLTRVTTAEAALPCRDRLVFVVPEDEATVVRDFEALRDRFLDPPRSQPVVVFLLRDGPGQRALAAAPGFAGVVRGSDPDPEALAEVDPRAERREFKRRAGLTPRAWLSRWRAGKIRQDSGNLALAYRALLLEGR